MDNKRLLTENKKITTLVYTLYTGTITYLSKLV